MNVTMADRQHAAEEIAQACRMMSDRQLVVGNAGNVSVRLGTVTAITRTGTVFGEATADDVVFVSAEGEVIGGSGVPSSELEIHQLCGKANGATAVVHTHSLFATSVATVAKVLPAVHYYIGRLGGPVAVAPYATFGSSKLAALSSEGMGADRDAVLLANHGAVVRAATLSEAVDRAILLEWLCQLYWHASQLGTPTILSDHELDDVQQMRKTMRARIASSAFTAERV